MTYQTTAPLTNYRLTIRNHTASEVAGHVFSQTDMRPPYQRGDVWTTEQRMGLVRSWLMGVPVPAIVLNNRCSPVWEGEHPDETGGPAWAVVDGKQRMQTAKMWFTGQIFVPRSWLPRGDAPGYKYTDDGPYSSFNDLSDVAYRRCRRSFILPVIEAELPTVQAEAELYLLLNGGGTPQTDNDMANAARVAAEES